MQVVGTITAINDVKEWPSNTNFISANNVNNIVIMGGGLVNGQGVFE
jgi:hypothetical protein